MSFYWVSPLFSCYSINNYVLENISCFKDLGVLFASRLKLSLQIEFSRITRLSRFWPLLRNGLTNLMARVFVNAYTLVRPICEVSVDLWVTLIEQSLFRKIFFSLLYAVCHGKLGIIMNAVTFIIIVLSLPVLCFLLSLAYQR